MKLRSKLTGRAANGLATLKAISAETQTSYKTIKQIYTIAGSPAMKEPMEVHRDYVRKAASGAIKLPKDMADQMILIKFERSKHNRDKEREWAEEKRLKNLETKGRLVERENVKAQGASFAVAFCSVTDGFEHDGPGQCVGKSELDLHRIFRAHNDKLKSMMREAVSKLNNLSSANVE